MKVEKPGFSDLTENRYKVFLFLIRMGGIPVNMPEVSKSYTIYSTFTIVCFYCALLCIFLDCYHKREVLNDMMNTLRILLGTVVTTWMYFVLRIQKTKLENIITVTELFKWDDLPSRDSENRLTMAGFVPVVGKVTRAAAMIMTVCHFSQSAFRMITKREMFLPTWYPFDVSISPVYEIVNGTQVFAFIFIVGIFIGYQGMYATLVCVACSQLEKIKQSLLNITQSDHKHEQMMWDAQRQKDTEDNTVYYTSTSPEKQLNECIRHHQLVRLYMDELEDFLNVSLGGLFFLLLVTLCLIAFSAVTSWEVPADLTQAFVMYVFMMANVFVFSWLGNELSVEAESIADAAWACEWIGCSTSFQRCLVMVIASANRGFYLTAGKFVPVSNKTMMNMLNQSASFFMFLLTMKGKNEEKNM